MDKCPKCGGKLSSIDVLCQKCGALVEVVQVRKGSGAQNAASVLGVPVKKLPPQNLVLYNDDWPSDDMEGSILPDETPPIISDQPDSPREAIEAAAPAQENVTIQKLQKAAMVSDEESTGSEESYLAMIRNMHLPELESIGGNYDPAEPERVEAGSPSKLFKAPMAAPPSETPTLPIQRRAAQPYEAPVQLSDMPAAPPIERRSKTLKADPHRWLEIEEVDSADSSASTPDVPAAAPAPMPAENIVPALDQAATEAIGYRRRYRMEHPETEAAAPRTHRSGRVLLMVFIWLVISCVLFCGFYLLDQYVTDRYGSYPAMFYEFSGGHINLNASADAQSAPVKTPAP